MISPSNSGSQGAIAPSEFGSDAIVRLFATARAAAAFIVATCLLTACAVNDASNSADPLPPPAVLPSFVEIVQRYNANLERVDRLWARAVVELEWREKGKRRFEQGEGHLIMVLPDRVALTIGKLGQDGFWAGCDAERYWLFDLRGERVVHVGKHAWADKPCVRSLGLPVMPMELPRLLGLTTIDPEHEPVAPAVEWIHGSLVIEPVGHSSRLFLDPVTARPVRIDLLDETGHSRVTCRLTQYEPMPVAGAAPGAYPHIATRAVITITGAGLQERSGKATLHLADPTDGREEDRIREKAFDFDALIKAHKPSVIDLLDRDCE